MRKTLVSLGALLLAGSCQPTPSPVDPSHRLSLRPDAPRARRAPPDELGRSIWAVTRAPRPTKRVGKLPSATKLKQRIQSYFAGHVGRRIYIQLDKPLYKPGETLWVKTWDLLARDLKGPKHVAGIRYQLVSPRGSVVLRKRVRQRQGTATNDFVLPTGLAGGEYKLRVISWDGRRAERPVVISTYEPPRIKKKLEFLRKAYGPGDEVTATVHVKRPTGEALAAKTLSAVISVDNRPLPTVRVTTNAKGGAIIRFKLPRKIKNGDGLLTVMVADGGVTESVSRRIPILLNRVRFSMFPEGGNLVTGLRSRVYFGAKNLIGKPADVSGKVVDDHGNLVARFRSYFHGMGRFTFRPATGRRYHVEITKPRSIAEKFSLPLAEKDGCVLNSYDDYNSSKKRIVVRIACTQRRTVVVSAMVRENLLDAAAVKVRRGKAAVVHLSSAKKRLNTAQGVARVTVFDAKLRPLAERLVYRNRNNRLRVSIKTHRKSYQPRNKVSVTAKTTDAKGNPVSAELALSVVNDTVVSFADDKTGHMLSRLYLEHEIPGKVHEPNKYFDAKNKLAARGLDLLMGTRGWRKFAWKRVLNPVRTYTTTGSMRGRRGLVVVTKNKIEIIRGRLPRVLPRAAAPQPKKPAPVVKAVKKEKKRLQKAGDVRRHAMPKAAMRQARARRPRRRWGRGLRGLMIRRALRGRPAWVWARVRVFPTPSYKPGYQGPRTDFRETIYWKPNLKTDKSGKGEVSFYVSDAITSFRIFAEGVGGGLAGRNETVFKSNLPFSMYVKLPLEVSAGDQLNLPLTLTNETAKPLAVAVTASFGKLLTARRSARLRTIRLAPKQRRSLYYPVRVTGKRGLSKVLFLAKAGNLTDEFTRKVNVVPQGFPQQISVSGEVGRKARHALDLGQVVPGSVTASVRLYPSPVASMTSGMEGMLRQPSGCFEQASSTNYPNVMIMSYLKEHDINDAALLQKSSRLLNAGYRKLTGYESPQRGYEWFGGNPGHEALTAYGLLEFVDMKRVYGSVSRPMIRRTAKWLLNRRDGNGGFKRNSRALDSFGRASKAVTDAYITWSLSEAGTKGIGRLVRQQLKLSRDTKDGYLLALAANTLLNTAGHKAAGRAAARRLASMQSPGGAWTNANHSITRSGGKNLKIETTALASLALIKAGGHGSKVRRSMSWLNKNRGGYGRWGSTQATILGLRAMLAYAKASRKTKHSGAISLKIAGRTIGRISYKAGHRKPLLFAELGKRFARGSNRLEILKRGKGKLPYSVAVSYRSKVPASSAKSVVALSTQLARTRMKMGETVKLTVTVTNKTNKGQPMTLARVGFPGGLTFQTWQLKELRTKGIIAFYETRAREVILYFRQLKPNQSRKIPITLVATVPGSYTAPASSAYLYYTDEHKTWVKPVVAKITM